ncbi:MAG: DEAD/DEAH box helicase [Gammaproteobacteria bacterium]|nr:DEAD/DEAH box helicase [Gammaproteobacteria bacterium]
MSLIRDVRDFSGFFSQQSLARGRRYCEDGQVLHLECAADSAQRLELFAEVQGSEPFPYEVGIQVEQRRRKLELVSDCSCPVGFLCKHAAAALHAFLARRQPDAGESQVRRLRAAEEQRLRAWLDNLAQAEREPPAGNNEELHFLIGHREGSAPLLAYHLSPVTIYRKKTGGWSKPKPVSLGYFKRATAPAALQSDEAVRLLALLNAEASFSDYGKSITLTGPGGAHALREVVGTGRCHFGDVNAPALSLSEPRRIAPSWQPGADGQQRLVLGEPDWRIVPSAPPYALDLTANQAFALDLGLPPAQAAQLCQAPALSEELAESAAALLALRLPALPRPRATGPAAREDLRPTPILRLAAMALPRYLDYLGGDSGRLYYASLEFDYAGTRIAADATAPIIEVDGQRVRRHPEEQAAAARLNGEFMPLLKRVPSYAARELPAPAWTLETPGHWLRWLLAGPAAFQAEGWRVEFDTSFDLRLLEPGGWYADFEEGGKDDWFDLALGITLNGMRFNLLPALQEALIMGTLDRDWQDILLPGPEAGQYVRLAGERLKTLVATLVELYGAKLNKEGRLKLPASQAYRLERIADLEWRGGERLRATVAKLRDFQGLQAAATPAGFAATLRPYQGLGLAWLQFLRDYDLNGILADDMGLGKTLQTLAHVLTEKAAGRLKHPALVVCPTSLVANWRSEAARFAPDLKTLVLHGAKRHGSFAELKSCDLAITTYPLIARDLEALKKQRLHLLILDEAQTIKNPKAKASEAVRALKAAHRLCLTGTPMENHLGELWSLMDFLMPGLLGDAETFRRVYRKPIENQGDSERQAALSQRLGPFMLRRRKQDVLAELPPKTEITRTIALSGKQRDLYESVRMSVQEDLRKAIAAKGLGRSQIAVLDALLKLRQVCCDPRLVKLDSAKTVKDSAKLDFLMELLPSLVEEGRRVLLFSQFTEMLGLVEEAVTQAGIAYVKLTGQTKDRETPVRRFQNGEVPLFLISLKAGGTGLNLTAADTVILYDPWWNPAVEAQAADRAHRIGQDKPVFVYRLVSEDTVEEKILALQERKRALAESVYGGEGGGAAAFTTEDLEALLKPLE